MSLNILVITMAFHTYLAHVVARAQDQPMSFFAGSSILKRVRSISPGKRLPSYDNQDAKEDDDMRLMHARRLNRFGKISFAALGILFNIIFWSVALAEYVRPAEEYFISKD